MNDDLPLWRSMLFVPANVERFINGAADRGADALILDLEDSVPLTEKTKARENILSSARKVSRNGADVVVRINNEPELTILDLEACVSNTVQAICIPKVASADELQKISETIDRFEQLKKIPKGQTRIIALIETPDALFHLQEIARSTPRLVAMILGSEDFSTAVGMVPTPEALLYPNQQVLFAARSANIIPLGFIASIAEYSDLNAFRELIRRSASLGFQGGFCIHPDQVQIMNEEFSPSSKEVSDAEALIDIYEDALKQGCGTVSFKGKMIDTPVVNRAKNLIAIHKKIEARGLSIN